MKIKIFLLAAVLMGSLSVTAQTHTGASTHHRGRTTGSAFVQRYVDSLMQYRAAQDSLQLLGLIPSQGIEYSKLFLPATFYRNVARDNFSLSTTTTPLDDILLNIYLRRPDLVQTKETELLAEGGTLEPRKMGVKHSPELVEKVAPAPIEPKAEDVDLIVTKPNFWSISGDYYLQFLQNYVSSNWYKGGESNYSMVGSLTLNANYNNKQKVKWDNKLEMKLGFQTSKQDSLHSLRVSENLIRLTSKFGLQASKHWYYTLQLIAYTQFMRQWESNSNVVTTDFMGPFNANLSLGMDYSVDWLNHKLTGSIHLAPVAYNFRYVNRESLATRYGIDEGKKSLHDFGSQFTADLTWKIDSNISWKTRLYGYTTYKRCELEWENTFTFQFNRWLSSNLFVYPRFDDGGQRDDDHGYFQFKEYASLGFSFQF